MPRIALGLILVLAACARESPAPAPRPQAAPAPSPPAASEPRRLPPMAQAPEMAAETEPGTEQGARAFVTAFLQARMAGDGRLARTHLSAIARDQYERGEGGLSLTGDSGSRFTGWDFASVNAADASSFEVKVGIRQGGGAPFTETLFVGPGPDAEGRQRPWVVRGALRENGAGPE